MKAEIPPPWLVDGRRRRLLRAGAALAVLPWPFASARAANWPTRPIRIIAAQAPGSSNDSTARAFAEYFTSVLKVPVVVENKPGGVGMIAAETVARSEPDGYTLLFTLHSQLAQAPVLLRKPPIDPSRDLVPIAAVSTGVGVMVANKNLPANNFKEVLALSRKRPVSVGNYGVGSGWQLMVAQLKKETGAQLDIINYKGTGAMMGDLLAGHIDVGAGSLLGMSGGLQSGGLKPILIISGPRSDRLPGIPTWADEGFNSPVFRNLTECNMLLGPAGLPPEIGARLADLVTKSITESEQVKMVRQQLGSQDTPLTGDALRQFIGRVWPTYQAATKAIGLTLQ
ncbi:tripartite tricarboxylate transporter substrate binding protein [Cupriavidus sp. DB3]|uniref:Bug family tripartite tricarboxylate transporter substrate binding protein n=1 Tax=Cupriavidus sp. DB3 TaxID=2873259 RepID=UPI001CF2FE87|nr:tripartite tricarboxylate transporter substrate binding protein [Cupriavidus sp. DB3]MCA7082709.1 tripartite tricarboxylate transporter substrate binding protein [Cupriavidus sp. DB3]